MISSPADSYPGSQKTKQRGKKHSPHEKMRFASRGRLGERKSANRKKNGANKKKRKKNREKREEKKK